MELKITYSRTGSDNWSKYFVMSVDFNLFLGNVPIYYIPWKHQEVFSFLVFAGIIKWEHWAQVG